MKRRHSALWFGGATLTALAFAVPAHADVPLAKPTTVKLAPAIAAYGTTVTLKATVLEKTGAMVPDGDVEFRVRDKVVGKAKTNTAGLATLAYPVDTSLGAGPAPMTARFLGKSGELPSSDDASLGLVKAGIKIEEAQIASTQTPSARSLYVRGWLKASTDGKQLENQPVSVSVNGKAWKTIPFSPYIPQANAIPESLFHLGANTVTIQYEGDAFHSPGKIDFVYQHAAFVPKKVELLTFDPNFRPPAVVKLGTSATIRVRVGQSASMGLPNAPIVHGEAGVKLTLEVIQHSNPPASATLLDHVQRLTCVSDAIGNCSFPVTFDHVGVDRRGDRVNTSLRIINMDDRYFVDEVPAQTAYVAIEK